MPPKRYHALVFISALVMLLLLGLHLLGVGYSSQQAAAALARNATSQPSSSASNVNPALSQSLMYRHPIVYDKSTGLVASNQINDVLGSNSKQVATDYPIDHYQNQHFQQQHQQLQPPIHQQQQHIFQPGLNDFFGPQMRQPHTLAFPPQPLGPLPPPPPLPPPHRGSASTPPTRHRFHPPLSPPNDPTTGLPSMNLGLPILGPLPPPPPPPPPVASEPRVAPPALDSATSASSLNSSPQNGTQLSPGAGQQAAKLTHRPEVQQRFATQMQQPPLQLQQTYYTPPIYAYNQFDQAARADAQAQPVVSGPGFGFPSQASSQQQQQQLPQNQEDLLQGGRNGNQRLRSRPQQQDNNLLVDPRDQARHKQQMLAGSRLYFGQPADPQLANQTALYYPDPALYRQRPPYSIGASSDSLEQPQFTSQKQQLQQQQQPAAPFQNRIAPQQPNSQLQQLSSTTIPNCARQQADQAAKGHPDSSWSSTSNISLALLPLVLFCNEDAEYPTKEVMRALELYAQDRSIEQLLPQLLVQLQLAQRAEPPNSRLGEIQRQVMLDSLQPSISLLRESAEKVNAQQSLLDESKQSSLFPSTSYESMCRATNYLAQPRRAKNLAGQWKVIVNLPGHRYRGTAVSQLVRVEECTRPMAECGGGGPSQRSSEATPPTGFRSRCLQQYETQRLVAWSSQQGLHVDLFRLPIGCGCHARR